MIHSTVFVWLIQIRAQMGLMATQVELARAMLERWALDRIGQPAWPSGKALEAGKQRALGSTPLCTPLLLSLQTL